MCRNTTYNRIRCHIFRYHSSGTYNGIITDSHSLKNRRIRTYPYIPTEYNRCRISRFTVFRNQPVIKCSKNDVMPDLATIANSHATMILKMTTSINKHTLTNDNILTEIRIKRWKDTERRRNLITEQPGE